MKLREIYKKDSMGKNLPISFEVFPPQDEAKTNELIDNLKILNKFNPSLISVTYGAGGSVRDRSEVVCKRLKSELNANLMPHLTCICSSKELVQHQIKDMENMGIQNILALRGDIPKDYVRPEGEYLKYASEMVKFVKENTSLSIGVAGYPEGHIEAESFEKDIEYLKLKVRLGAEAIFTQLFFDNSPFLHFLEKISDLNTPVIPGILPISNLEQGRKMTTMCSTSIPKKIEQKFEKYTKKEDLEKVGIEIAVEQIEELKTCGIAGLHFYTLNKSHMVSEILKAIM